MSEFIMCPACNMPIEFCSDFDGNDSLDFECENPECLENVEVSVDYEPIYSVEIYEAKNAVRIVRTHRYCDPFEVRFAACMLYKNFGNANAALNSVKIDCLGAVFDFTKIDWLEIYQNYFCDLGDSDES